MATFSEAQVVPNQGPPEYVNVNTSIAHQILNTDSPVDHPYAPARVGSPDYSCTPDTNTWEVISIPNGTGVIADFLVQLKVPRSMIILRGNDGGGSFGCVLSFVPLGQVGGIVTASSRLLNALGFQNYQVSQTGEPSASANAVIKFCKPVTRFYINAPDSGQPGSNTILWATDDFDFLANSRS